MRKTRIALLLLAVFIIFTFLSCAKRDTILTSGDNTITPTTAVVKPKASAQTGSVKAEDIQTSDTETTDNKTTDTETTNTDINNINADDAKITDTDIAKVTPAPDQVYIRTAQENQEYYEKVEKEKAQLYTIENPDYIYYYDPFFSDLIYVTDKKNNRTLYFLNGDCIFIKTDDAIGPTYESFKEEGDPVYENFEALIYDDSPEPFSKEIAGLLPGQMDKILKEEPIELPVNYYLLDYSTGDLNKDGQTDVAVVIEQAPGFYKGSRAIYIMLQDNGNYETAYENKSIILGRGEGGVLGDPFDGTIIENNALHIYDYGGSAFRWSHDYEFTYQDNQLILTKAEEISYNIGTGNGTIDYYDLINKTKETRTYSEAGDSADTPYTNLLLYSGTLKLAGNIRFKDAYSWCIDDYITYPDYLCPDLGFYEYGQHNYEADMQHTPEQMLDQVKEEYYPDMKKVSLQLRQGILDNYRLILGYRIPDYYYTDGVRILSYYGYQEFGDSGRYLHRIECYTINDKWDDNYLLTEYWDDTGEERSISE